MLAPLLAAALLAAAPAAAQPQVGPLQVTALRYRDAGGEWHAVRAARVAPAGRGITALTARAPRATRVSATFRAGPAERYLGFGERSNAVDQRGNDVESYVAEGPFEEDERAVVPAFVPAWGFHPRDDATYFPMPWLLSTAGYGVLVDNAETSVFRLGARRSWTVEVEAASLRLRVFAGPRPADVLRRLTGAVGRQPAPPGAFVFGPWYQPRDDEAAILARLQRRDVPLSVAQTYTHYLPCEAQRGRRPAERARVGRFHDAGLAVTTYFNPMICTEHTRFGRPGTLQRDPSGAPYAFSYSTLESFRVAQLDFGAAAGRRLYGELLREALADGHDGWMEDFGEYTPLDARSASGARGTALHNSYPTSYHCAAPRGGPPRGALRALGLDRNRALRADRVGRGPERRLGLRRAALGGDQRADDGALGSEHLGVGHRRVLRAVREPPDARAADPLDRGGRGVRRDAHAGERDPHPRQRAAAGAGTRACCRIGAAGRSCARSSTRTSPPPTARTAATASRSCATWRSPIRATAAPPPARTSSCSGPTCWRRRC